MPFLKCTGQRNIQYITNFSFASLKLQYEHEPLVQRHDYSKYRKLLKYRHTLYSAGPIFSPTYLGESHSKYRPSPSPKTIATLQDILYIFIKYVYYTLKLTFKLTSYALCTAVMCNFRKVKLLKNVQGGSLYIQLCLAIQSSVLRVQHGSRKTFALPLNIFLRH